MERRIDLEQISDGRLYGPEDMVKADCGGCGGCSACCQKMGKSVILDPLDVHRLAVGAKVGLEMLFSDCLELNVVDGIVVPNLKMTGVEEKCVFLGEDGRCRVHRFRPGFCRLFPLGRLYENGSFRYFLQVHECAKKNRTKVKVKKWMDTPDIRQYDAYISSWHYLLKELQKIGEEDETGQTAKNISMFILKEFYLTPYEESLDFYEQFRKRYEKACALFGTGRS